MKQLILLLLGMVWGYLVFGTTHSPSYEHATGYAPLRQTLPLAIAFALPMVIGALVINAREGWMKRLRWLCAFLLAAEAFFYFFITYIKILALPPLLGFLLLRSPDQKVKSAPSVETMMSWLTRNGWRVFGMGLFLLFVSWQIWRWINNPLPSDEEMINHFNEHRFELDHLVQGYRHYPYLKGGPGYEKSEKARTLMKRANVYHIIGAQGEAGSWYPDHYSTKTIQTLKGLYWGRSIHHQATWEEVLTTFRREIPALFENLPSDQDHTRVIKVVSIDLGTLKHPYQKCPLRYLWTCIYKGYYHFPQPPRIENGRILIHDFGNPNGLGPGQRVLESLDDYPPNWERGECVLKRINALWFITMCRTY